jgi:hypothetical protein
VEAYEYINKVTRAPTRRLGLFPREEEMVDQPPRGVYCRDVETVREHYKGTEGK